VVSRKIPFETRELIRRKESAKAFYNSLYSNIDSIIKHFPEVEKLSKFYEELVDVTIGIDSYKKNLGAINWAKFMVKKLYYLFLKRKIGLDELYGRSKSVLKQVSKNFEFLEKSRKQLSKFPSVKILPTVLLAGYPNVGKTSLLSELTESKPEINSYPFTTKDINVGMMKQDNYKIQVIDTPGLLERPFSGMNRIEKKAVTALKHLADIVLFIYDTSTTSGFAVKEQETLYKNVKTIFPEEKIYTITNKCELDKSKKTHFYVSCITGEGIKELKEFIIKKLLKKT